MSGAGGVEGEGSDESAVVEDLAGGAGDDGEDVLVVVSGADADAVAAFDPEAAVVDAGSVDLGGAGEGPIRGPGLGCGAPDLGGGAAGMAAVGALVVVDEPEDVELDLEVGVVGCRRLAGEPVFEGLVEPFDFSVGLGVIGPGVHGAHYELSEGWGQDVT